MNGAPPSIGASGAAMLLFAGVFLAGGRVHPLRPFVRDQRSAISVGAGVSIAYVFVHVLPELQLARRDVVEAGSVPVPFEGAAVYFLALIGFLLFYALDHVRLRLRLREPQRTGHADASFTLHVAGFAAYVALLSYLLVRDAPESRAMLALYAVTVAVHLLCVDHSLREEDGAAYERIGRYVLAGSALVGWAGGLFVAVPALALAALMALISGAIIVNSAIMELPTEKDGRFLPFALGGFLYGATLLAFV